MKKILLIVAAAVVVAAVAVGAVLVVAGDSEETVRGTCGSSATYELAVEDEDDALEVTFELQSAGSDEPWAVVVEQDGTSLFDGERPVDEDGEVDLDVVADEGDGDRFTVTATPAQGEPCTAELTRG